MQWHRPRVVKVEAFERTKSESLVVRIVQRHRHRLTRVDSQRPSGGLTVRVDDDHLDRKIGLILHIEGRSEGDDLDVVLQLDIASDLMRNLVESRT